MNAPVIGLLLRTRLQAVRLVLVVLVLLVCISPLDSQTFTLDPRCWDLILQFTQNANISTDACTCEKASDGGLLPTETDFTTKA